MDQPHPQPNPTLSSRPTRPSRPLDQGSRASPYCSQPAAFIAGQAPPLPSHKTERAHLPDLPSPPCLALGAHSTGQDRAGATATSHSSHICTRNPHHRPSVIFTRPPTCPHTTFPTGTSRGPRLLRGRAFLSDRLHVGSLDQHRRRASIVGTSSPARSWLPCRGRHILLGAGKFAAIHQTYTHTLISNEQVSLEVASTSHRHRY